MNIIIREVKKHYFNGTHRVCLPKETQEFAEPLMDTIGVSELAEITSIDRLGIPCFAAYRTTAPPGGFRFHPGKGRNPEEARASAMMEAIEKFSGEYHGQRRDLASFEELGPFKAVDPEELIPSRKIEENEKIHWTPGHDILYDEEVLVPSNAVFHPYPPGGMARPLFKSDTTGMASGNVTEEAILYGMLEVLEKDALSCADRERSMGTRLVVDRQGPAGTLLDIFEKAGIDIHLWLLEGRTGIPTIAAAADDTVTKDPSLLVVGAASHTNPETACLQALTEVARNRAAHIYKGEFHPEREMILQKAGYERIKRINKDWFAERNEISLNELTDMSTSSIDQDIRVVMDELRPHVERICVCDLTVTAVPAVRVVIPGLEVSHVNKERVRKF
ncbi:MAG TPA: YcaO-like family protein [Methanoregulaceae archaeon]|nr:YcaO-like family protein [Methanoregulaceae archaeon]